MSLIKIEGIASTSAPTKAQKDAAVYLFGSKGHSIVAVLDKFSRAKELRTAHLDGLLKLMKEGEDDEIIKFAASAPGKKTIANAKAFAVAKTLTAAIKALKLIRVPVKWVEGHSDVAAARIQETKEIRARKTAGNKPEKPIKLDNPGAPESTTVDNKVIDAKKGSATEGKIKNFPDAEILSIKTAGKTTTISCQFPGTSNKWKVSATIDGEIVSFAFSERNAREVSVLEPWFEAVAKKVKGKIDYYHVDSEVADVGFATEAQAAKFLAAIKKEKRQIVEKPAGFYLSERIKGNAVSPKSNAPVAKPEAYKPSGKSDIALVDELAEVTARKISAKPLQAREEYLNALRNIIQNNLRKAEVSATSTGVVVSVGSKMYTIRLDNNAWTIQTGVTGRVKKIGATFDIVDLLGMIDKSILRPKA